MSYGAMLLLRDWLLVTSLGKTGLSTGMFNGAVLYRRLPVLPRAEPVFRRPPGLANVKVEYYGLYKVDAMYKMILKQLWNERKGNLFIWLEMLVVSIFLWYAADALFVMYRLYSQPLGFNIEHTYHVSFGVIPEESPDYDTTSVHSERGGGDYLTLMDRIPPEPLRGINLFHHRRAFSLPGIESIRHVPEGLVDP